jgi:hypothetical protein
MLNVVVGGPVMVINKVWNNNSMGIERSLYLYGNYEFNEKFI